MTSANNVPMVSRGDIEMVVRDRKSLHAACLANGYVLPSLTAGICTIDFIYAAQAGHVWIPMVGDMHDFRGVNRPPLRTYLLGEIQNALGDAASELGESDPKVDALMELGNHLQARSSDTKWLVQVLYVLNRRHEIFDKGYAYYRTKKTTDIDAIPVLPNPAGFYEGLPQLPLGRLKKSRLRLSKDMRLKIQLVKAREAQRNAELRIEHAY